MKIWIGKQFCGSAIPFELDSRVVQNPFVSPEALHLIVQLEELSLVFHLFLVEVLIFLVTQHFPATKTRSKTVHTS